MKIKEPLKYVCLWQDNLTEILMSLFQPSLIQLRVGLLAPRSVSVVITGITHPQLQMTICHSLDFP